MARVLLSHSRGFGFYSGWDRELYRGFSRGFSFHFPESPWLLGGVACGCAGQGRGKGGMAFRATVLGNPEGAASQVPGSPWALPFPLIKSLPTAPPHAVLWAQDALSPRPEPVLGHPPKELQKVSS